MIHIDFQGGAHGNYLEFVCNKMAGLTVGKPFNSLGASHDKHYVDKKMFVADHYSFWPKPFVFDKIISVQISVDDLLPLQQISLLRAGDLEYDNDYLEIDTYNKLNIWQYQWVLDEILQGFFTDQIKKSYDAIKDSSWPKVITLDDFKKLPAKIKQECIEKHNLMLLELSPTSPDCPRPILREFFQIGFEQPEQHGFIARQNQIKYSSNQQIYYFPFSCFYNKIEFLQQLKKIAEWAEILYTCEQDVEQLHDEFLLKQPYQNSKFKCNEIISTIKAQQTITQKVDLLEEAYINAKLGWNYFA
jgi:hypothetical protein